MAGYLDHNDISEELGMGTSVEPEKVFAKFIHTTIKQTMMPRKILIKSAQGIFKILASRSKIVGYQEPDASEPVWVDDSEIEQKELEELEVRAGVALEKGIISVAMLDKKELEELGKRQSDNVLLDNSSDLELSGIISLDDEVQQTKSSTLNVKTTTPGVEFTTKKPVMAGELVIESFFESLDSKVRFAILFDHSGKKISMLGSSGTLDEALYANLIPALKTWNEATSGILSDEPKMIISGGVANSGHAVIFAFDGNQYIFAEVEMRKFGIISGLWNKASKVGNDA